MNIPNNFNLCYSDVQIAEACNRLGRDISEWAHGAWEDSHADVIAVPVLRGGIFFFADLVRSVTCSLEIAPVKTWAYVDAVNEAQLETVQVDIESVPSKGRRVLLIDDICDSGRTLDALKQAFLRDGAIEVKSAVLIKRKLEDSVFNPDWVGFEYKGPEWFVGYGMEDANRWRNLSSVYIIKQS